jgi:CO/xanthine dehydrogenase Mo-binding subunit
MIEDRMDEFQYLGRHIVNEDVRDKARGRAVFTGDLKLPKMLHARILRSPFAHARIRAIDKQRAVKVPGVKAILLGKDRPLRFGQATVKDRPVLAWERVLHSGEPVAVVAALDEQAACEALESIDVDYEPLPAVFDPLKAMEPDAPLLHPDLDTYPRQGFIHPVRGTNICYHAYLRTGDVEKGFKESDRVYENVFRIPAIQHCPLELHVAVAKADAGRVTLWCSTQAPFVFRSEICETLGWPLSRLRVIAPAVGGGFGGKGSPCIEPIAVVLALETDGLPVRLCLDRDEEFITKVRPALVYSVKTGVKRDGTLVAFEGKLYYDNGAYADQGPVIARNSSYSAMGPYRIPHVTTDVYLVYTNNPVSSAFRGFGIPETAWGCESQMDIIAADLNIDPVTIRMKNALEEGSISATGEVVRSVGVKGCLHHVRSVMPQETGQSTGVGRGFAAAFKSGGGAASSSVLLRMNEDGTATLMTSAVDMGQGLKATLSQIAAEESGLDPRNIRVSFPDTDVTPYEWSTVASRATFSVGNSTRMAAAEVKKQILEIACGILECHPEDLLIREGKIWVKEEPSRNIKIAELWEGAVASKKQYPILGRGVFSTAELIKPPDRSTGRSARPTAFWMYGAQGVEIGVCEDTGRIELLRVVAAQDAGRVVDPIQCEGQIEGCVAMGIGGALTEELLFEGGRLLNPDWSTYKIPTASDVPPIVPLTVEDPHPDGPYGAKGIAEVGVAPTAPAISNALFQLTGVRMYDLPLTPEKVYWALKKRKGTTTR